MRLIVPVKVGSSRRTISPTMVARDLCPLLLRGLLRLMRDDRAVWVALEDREDASRVGHEDALSGVVEVDDPTLQHVGGGG